MSLDNIYDYEVSIKFLEDNEIEEYDIKYGIKINKEHSDDIIELNYIANYKCNDIEYEAFVKCIQLSPTEQDEFNNTVIWGASSKSPINLHLDDKDTMLARHIVEQTINKYVNDIIKLASEINEENGDI